MMPAPAALSSAEALLERLGTGGREVLDCRDVIVVVAHPDDETIALGGQLGRMRGIRIIHVTDGAPFDMADALACGFSTREDYANARRRELEEAMALAGVGPDRLLSLGLPDQTAPRNLAAAARRLSEMFGGGGVRTVLTHCYEGGHPDHDATAFAVRAACRLLALPGGRGRRRDSRSALRSR